MLKRSGILMALFITMLFNTDVCAQDTSQNTKSDSSVFKWAHKGIVMFIGDYTVWADDFFIYRDTSKKVNLDSLMKHPKIRSILWFKKHPDGSTGVYYWIKGRGYIYKDTNSMND